MNFDKLILSKAEKKTLKCLGRDALPLDNPICPRLVRLGLVTRPVVGTNEIGVPFCGKSYVLTDDGRLLLIYLQGVRRTSRIEWIRWGVTTAIALAAFAKSFFF